MPAEQRFGLNQEGVPPRTLQAPRQCRQDQTIARVPAGTTVATLEDPQLMPQDEQLGLILGTITLSSQVENDLQAGVKGGEEHRRRPSYPSPDLQRVACLPEYGWTFGTLQVPRA